MLVFFIAVFVVALVFYLGLGFWGALVVAVVVLAEMYLRYREKRTKHARAWLGYYCGEKSDEALDSFLQIERITHDIQDYLERHAYGSNLHGLIGPYRHVRDPNQVLTLLRYLQDAGADVRRRCFMSQGKVVALYQLEALWRAWFTLYRHSDIAQFFSQEASEKKQAFAAS